MAYKISCGCSWTIGFAALHGMCHIGVCGRSVTKLHCLHNRSQTPRMQNKYKLSKKLTVVRVSSKVLFSSSLTLLRLPYFCPNSMTTKEAEKHKTDSIHDLVTAKKLFTKTAIITMKADLPFLFESRFRPWKQSSSKLTYEVIVGSLPASPEHLTCSDANPVRM